MMVPMFAGDGMDGTVWTTPGEMRAEQENVDAAVQNLDRDIRASGAPSAFVQAWSRWKATWDQFYADQGGVLGWFGRFATSGPMQKTLDYRGQLEDWRVRFLQLGGLSSSPGLPKPPPNPFENTARYVAIAAGALGGLWLLSTLYREFRRPQ